MKTSITTGQGNAGTTKALDGTVLEKYHPMIEAVGALDALRTQTALLRLQLQEKYPGDLREIEFLLFLLHSYFLVGASISAPHNHKAEGQRDEIARTHIERLKEEQQRMESTLHLPDSFIVSATNRVSAQADIVATTARSFERRLVAFCAETPTFDSALCQTFSNRLSDYFFVLARYLEKGHHQAVSYDLAEEY